MTCEAVQAAVGAEDLKVPRTPPVGFSEGLSCENEVEHFGSPSSAYLRKFSKFFSCGVRAVSELYPSFHQNADYWGALLVLESNISRSSATNVANAD